MFTGLTELFSSDYTLVYTDDEDAAANKTEGTKEAKKGKWYSPPVCGRCHNAWGEEANTRYMC